MHLSCRMYLSCRRVKYAFKLPDVFKLPGEFEKSKIKTLNSLLGRGGLNCESPLYFETEYQIFLFKKELKKLFLLWHKMYPLNFI